MQPKELQQVRQEAQVLRRNARRGHVSGLTEACPKTQAEVHLRQTLGCLKSSLAAAFLHVPSAGQPRAAAEARV